MPGTDRVGLAVSISVYRVMTSTPAVMTFTIAEMTSTIAEMTSIGSYHKARAHVPYVTCPRNLCYEPAAAHSVSVDEVSTLAGFIAAVVSVDAMWVDVTIVGLPLSYQAYECIPLRK